MNNVTTTDLGEFGPREIKMTAGLLNAWIAQGLPEAFYREKVTVMMNKDSGSVFLTNSEYQVAMMNGDNLEMWHICPNCGHEGFAEDFLCSDDGEKCIDLQDVKVGE